MLSVPVQYADPRKRMLIVVVNLAVAGAHLVTGPHYRGPVRWFVTGYLIDVLLPFAAYLLLCLAEEEAAWLRSWPAKALTVFLVVSSAEVAQYFGAPIFGRTFDPLDFGAYAFGALAAACADRLLFPSWFGFWSSPAA